jgi:hypothetical protein
MLVNLHKKEENLWLFIVCCFIFLPVFSTIVFLTAVQEISRSYSLEADKFSKNSRNLIWEKASPPQLFSSPLRGILSFHIPPNLQFQLFFVYSHQFTFKFHSSYTHIHSPPDPTILRILSSVHLQIQLFFVYSHPFTSRFNYSSYTLIRSPPD